MVCPTLSGIHIYPVKSCHAFNVDECRVGNLGIDHDRHFMIVDDANVFISQRKFPSLTLIRPVIDVEKSTLTLAAPNQAPLVLPLRPSLNTLKTRRVKLWKHMLDVYDMGDDAAGWIDKFLAKHRMVDRETAPDIDRDEKNHHMRIVVLGPPIQSTYQRQVHPKIPGVHSPFSDWSPISIGFETSLTAVNAGLVRTNISQGQTIPMNRFRNNLTVQGTTAWEEEDWLVIRIGEVTLYIVRPIPRCTMPGIDQDSSQVDNWGGVLKYLRLEHTLPERPNDGFFCMDAIPLTSGTIHVGDEIEILERIPEVKKH